MNAHVEVATAAVATNVQKVMVLVTNAFFNKVGLLAKAVASTVRVISQGSHSISAVAPDTNFIGGLA